MKVQNVRSFCLAGESGRPYFVVKVDTDDGIHGLGEVGMVRQGAAGAQAVNQLSELVVGEDPLSTERLWQHMFRRNFFPAEGIYATALSAIDIALWDIKGKVLGLPVYKLLGGPVRDKVVCYPHADGKTDSELVESCSKFVSEGWKFVRWGLCERVGGTESDGGDGTLDPVGAIDSAVRQMAMVREAIGPHRHVCLDVHTRLDTSHVIDLCQELEPYKPYFIEDPLRSENPASYRTLARHIRLPIAAGEQWTSKWRFREVIEEELIRYARIDLCNVGGITEALKVAHWCETHYIDLAPHNPLGPVSAAAGAALCMAVTNVGVLEMPRAPGSLDTDLFPLQIGWEDGYAYCRNVPGLGVEMDEEVARKRTVNPGGFPPRLRRKDGAYTNW